MEIHKKMFTNKNERKYFGALRRLAKLDDSIFNGLKVTVCEGEFVEEKQCFLIAPLMLFESGRDLDSQKLNQKLTDKTFENSTEQCEISNENKNESLDDYPNSSDFSDDD